MRQSIRGYTDGLIALAALAPPGGESSLATLASESAAVRGVVDGSDELRRALSDPGIPLAARRQVLRDLFANQIGSASMRLVDFVLESDRASDTAEDIRWVAERLSAARDGLAPLGDVVLGTKGAEERIEGFATAVLETAGDRALGEIEDELFRFARLVAGSEQLRDVLTNRDYPAAVRRGLVSDLLRSKTTPATVALATYATQVGRPRDYEELLEVLVNRVASESNRRLADVRSAVALDDDQERKLAEALSRAVGRNVEIRVTVDPSVIAGFVATIGDTVVDGSARHQLELLKERLVSPEAQLTTGHITTGHITTEERH